jgi:peptidyl-tRNA hydrolase
LGTAFTYQGRLTKDGRPVGFPNTETCDFRFGLWDDATGGVQHGNSPFGPISVPVSVGLFSVNLDFGPGAIDGTARWLEIEVQCAGDPIFVLLSPRVELTPVPHAIRASEGVGPPNALEVESATGNVGIGTATPAAQLDVNGAARATTLEITGGSLLQQSLFGWGSNDSGETTVPPGTFTAVAAGYSHGLAIRTDETLVGWGSNDWGQINVPAGTFIAVATNYYHSLGIRSDGILVGWGEGPQAVVPSGWGYNFVGQIDVPAGTFIAVAAGSLHALAIRSDGTLVGWGDNTYGQTDVPSGTFTALAAGAQHGLGLKDDGSIVAWGWNFFGHTDVPPGTFTTMAAGSAHNLAIRSDGTLVGWGRNHAGQTVVPPGTFTAVAAGDAHSLAIVSDLDDRPPALRLHNNSAYKPGSDRWTISSDRRLKKNIEPLSGALERLLQLRGVTFQWLDPASQGGITGTQMGLIADEVQRAFPQWVGRDPKGYQTLTVGGFEALTAEALRELRAEKDRQLSEKDVQIRELKARVERLEATLERIAGTQNGGGR